MGLLSIFTGAVATIGAVITKVCNVAGTVLKAATGAIETFAKKAVETGEKLLPKVKNAADYIGIAGGVVGQMAEKLDIKKEGKDSPHQLGYKAEVSEKKSEEFNTSREYVKHLQNNVSIDENKMKQMPKEELAAYSAVGSHVYIGAIPEMIGVERNRITPELLLNVAKAGIAAVQAIAIITKLKQAELQPEAMCDFLQGVSRSLDERLAVKKVMTEAIKVADAHMTDEDAANVLNDMQDAVKDPDREVEYEW